METNENDIQLTGQEKRILKLVVEGKRYKEIADALGLTEQTIKWYGMRLRYKFHASTSSELVHKVTEMGLL